MGKKGKQCGKEILTEGFLPYFFYNEIFLSNFAVENNKQ